jgi:O-acetyl-ADP-ribose deacetylase (regulator of RNase III)
MAFTADSATIDSVRIKLVVGDITRQQVDAIVNAANSKLAGGGGVDGAIHRAGGPTIMAETKRRYPEGCPTGSAVISSAGNLSAQYVIHAVGPVWSGGKRGEAGQLKSAYGASLELAASNNCRSIALPALSTGAYRYPLDAAAHIAVGTAAEFAQNSREIRSLSLIRFVLFSEAAMASFREALKELSESSDAHDK